MAKKAKKDEVKKEEKWLGLNDQEKKEIAIGLVTGQKMKFTEDQLQTISALPLMWGALSGLSKEEIDNIAAVIGDMKDTLSNMGVNGYPIFKAVQIISKKDWPDIVKMYEEKHKALYG